jgi:dienelactone hydrolase
VDHAGKHPLEMMTVSTEHITHEVWFGPGNGPGVLLLHELAGLSQNTAALAESHIVAGFTVAMPRLFGRVGAVGNEGMAAGFASLLGRCIAREMSLFLRDHPPRGTEWLKKAVATLDGRSVSPRGVGVIGMCATGSFAMATVLDPQVGAVVASQAALPVLRPGSWGVPGGDQKLADGDAAVMALRFCTDGKSPRRRVTRLPERMNETLDSSTKGPVDPNLPHAERGIEVRAGKRLHVVWAGGAGHSVLTADRVDLAVAAVIEFLRENIGPVPTTRPSGV